MITIVVRERVRLGRVEVKTIGMRCIVGLGESRKKRSFFVNHNKDVCNQQKTFFFNKIACTVHIF
jgi:hypothetical protein